MAVVSIWNEMDTFCKSASMLMEKLMGLGRKGVVMFLIAGERR